ncbi:MAG TPA: hypothetical protein PLK06_03330, partial [bacterium]|nr:hypothetical protein [bacterium]
VDSFGERIPVATHVLHEVREEPHELVVGVPRGIASLVGALDVDNQLSKFHGHLLNTRNGLSETRRSKVLYEELKVNLSVCLPQFYCVQKMTKNLFKF